MAELVVPIVAVATIAAVVVLGIGVFVLRRFVLSSALGTFDCSLRKDTAQAGGGWMLGVARYEADRLDWFRIFTMNPRPGRSLARARLAILERRPPEGAETYAVIPGSVIVRCSYGNVVLELAMSEPAYNGFATWLESAPPGQRVDVA